MAAEIDMCDIVETYYKNIQPEAIAERHRIASTMTDATSTNPESLPPYTHIPGVTPHPLRDPRGHSFGQFHAPCPSPDWAGLPDCEPFQHGRRLFNAGYYWEAHEAWEGVWIAAGRAGLVADYVKGLIKLAAAGVKVREGSATGAQRHLARSHELFLLTASRLPDPADDLNRLLALVRRLQESPLTTPEPNAGRPVIVLGQV